MMRSTPASARNASGLTKPCVSEMSPIFIYLTPIHSHEVGLREFVGLDIEADERRRGIRRDLQLRHLQGEDAEVIMMWLAGWRTGTTVAERTKIASSLDGTCGHALLLHVTRLGR